MPLPITYVQMTTLTISNKPKKIDVKLYFFTNTAVNVSAITTAVNTAVNADQNPLTVAKTIAVAVKPLGPLVSVDVTDTNSGTGCTCFYNSNLP